MLPYDISFVKEFKEGLTNLLKADSLDVPGWTSFGICMYLRVHFKDDHRHYDYSYKAIGILLNDDSLYNRRIEPEGVFGPLRKTFVSLLVSMPDEDLLEILNTYRDQF